MTKYKHTEYRCESVADFPNEVAAGVVYLVGKENDKWAALFECPCGCDSVIHLNLISGSRPLWKIVSRNPITIRPSIKRIEGCRSHFHIREGEVV